MTKDDLPPEWSAEVQARGEAVLHTTGKPPYAVFRLLALIVQIKPGVPFTSKQPGHLTHKQIAAYLKISVPSLYLVLRQYVAEGYLIKRSEDVPGSVVTLTFYDPSPELRGLIEPLL
jgi:hypothetical protein